MSQFHSDLDTARLKLARERKGLTQIDISNRLGVAATLAGQWERGQKEPRLGTLKALCSLLDVTPGWLLGIDEPKPNRIAEAPGRYRSPSRLHASREAVLTDYGAPPGLRDLAQTGDLVQALRPTSDEWLALSSVDFSDGLTQEGYIALLMLLRTSSIESCRHKLNTGPGRPTGAVTES